MFESAIRINQFQLRHFNAVIADLPRELMFQPAAGHGHPPVWILGHLAITGEMGQHLLGGEVRHPEWMPTFGPGSSDRLPDDDTIDPDALITVIQQAYPVLQRLAAEANVEQLAQPHGIPLLSGSPIQSIGDVVTLLLTNHFGFHLSQLSSCRRAAGHPPLL